MQQNDLLNQDLQFNPRIFSFLKESARWSKFLSIVGFITTGFILLIAFFVPAFIKHFSEEEFPQFNISSSITGIVINFFILALFVFIPSLFLLRFSDKMKEALEQINQISFEESFENLKGLFKFYGILTIIVLSLYGIGILGFIIGMNS